VGSELIPMNLENDSIRAAFGAMSAIALDEEAGVAFDKLVTRANGALDFTYVLEHHPAHVVPRILAICLGGYLYNWSPQTAHALVDLHDHVLAASVEDDDFEFQVLARLLAVIRPVATRRARDLPALAADRLEQVGKAAAALARYLDEHDKSAAAASMATLAVKVLRRSGVGTPSHLVQFAVRLLDKEDKKVFLPLTARAKFPPPVPPGAPAGAVLQLALGAIGNIFLGFLKERGSTRAVISSVDSFNEQARLMLEDRDYVINMDVQFEYQYPGQATVKSAITRFEVRFAQSLLRRINHIIAAAPGVAVTPYNFLVDLVVQIIMKQRELHERRDENLHDWFVLAGAEPYREGSFFTEGVVFAKTLQHLLTVTIGETEGDIDSWVRYGFQGELARRLLRGDGPVRPSSPAV
jgi:hypothetical protein